MKIVAEEVDSSIFKILNNLKAMLYIVMRNDISMCIAWSAMLCLLMQQGYIS